MKSIVLALGGNAILKKNEKPSIQTQFKNTKRAMKSIANLVKKYSIVITHGNGPQVGNILIRTEEAIKKAYALPLFMCVAQSEGEMGYMIAQSLYNELKKRGIYKPIISLLTQVLVDRKDKAFENPTKPIGPYYSKKRIKELRKKFPIVIYRHACRRAVPSPKPLKIIEANIIKNLIKTSIVIAAGGGGIPVYKRGKELHGIDAVVDKDLASACLAKNIGAEMLIMLTDVPYVALNYKKKNQKNILKMNVKDAIKYTKMGEFEEGTMKPKIEAAIDFLKNSKGKKVIITNFSLVEKAIKGKAGTTIMR